MQAGKAQATSVLPRSWLAHRGYGQAQLTLFFQHSRLPPTCLFGRCLATNHPHPQGGVQLGLGQMSLGAPPSLLLFPVPHMST